MRTKQARVVIATLIVGRAAVWRQAVRRQANDGQSTIARNYLAGNGLRSVGSGAPAPSPRTSRASPGLMRGRWWVRVAE